MAGAIAEHQEVGRPIYLLLLSDGHPSASMHDILNGNADCGWHGAEGPRDSMKRMPTLCRRSINDRMHWMDPRAQREPSTANAAARKFSNGCPTSEKTAMRCRSTPFAIDMLGNS